MPPFVSLCMLALAVSLDGFGVGLTYGLRRIRIPLVSIGIVSFCSGLAFYVSLQAGELIASRIAPGTARDAGALLLIAIGVWAVLQILRSKNVSPDLPPNAPAGHPAAAEANGTTVARIELKRFGLVIQILRTPSLADMDRSGAISAKEAVVLGTALSFDAFGAGVGAALVGFDPFSAAIAVALTSGACIALGLGCGRKFSATGLLRKLTLLPGCILIVMGILKLIETSLSA